MIRVKLDFLVICILDLMTRQIQRSAGCVVKTGSCLIEYKLGRMMWKII